MLKSKLLVIVLMICLGLGASERVVPFFGGGDAAIMLPVLQQILDQAISQVGELEDIEGRIEDQFEEDILHSLVGEGLIRDWQEARITLRNNYSALSGIHNDLQRFTRRVEGGIIPGEIERELENALREIEEEATQRVREQRRTSQEERGHLSTAEQEAALIRDVQVATEESKIQAQEIAAQQLEMQQKLDEMRQDLYDKIYEADGARELAQLQAAMMGLQIDHIQLLGSTLERQLQALGRVEGLLEAQLEIMRQQNVASNQSSGGRSSDGIQEVPYGSLEVLPTYSDLLRSSGSDGEEEDD